MQISVKEAREQGLHKTKILEYEGQQVVRFYGSPRFMTAGLGLAGGKVIEVSLYAPLDIVDDKKPPMPKTEKRTWVIGDYCQFSPGQAPPEDWGAILRINGDTAEVLRGNNPHPIDTPLADLHPVESDDFKAAIKAHFIQTVNSQESLADIWNRYPP